MITLEKFDILVEAKRQESDEPEIRIIKEIDLSDNVREIRFYNDLCWDYDSGIDAIKRGETLLYKKQII